MLIFFIFSSFNLINCQILSNLTWDILFPFPRGTRESVDPLEAFGGINGITIGDETLYPSELVDGGNITWSRVTTDNNGYVQLSTSNVNWPLIERNLGSAADGTQGWAQTSFWIEETGIYYMQCMGMVSFFIDQIEYRGDLYQYGYWIVPVSLTIGNHILQIRLYRTWFQCQFVDRPGNSQESDQLLFTLQGDPYGPIIVPDIVTSIIEGAPVSNLAGGYLSFGLVNAGDAPTTGGSFHVISATQDGRTVSIDFDPDSIWFPSILPKQFFPVHGLLRLYDNIECSNSVALTIGISALIGVTLATITHDVTLKCIPFPGNSYVFTFPDYDGAIQYAAVIPPVAPCSRIMVNFTSQSLSTRLHSLSLKSSTSSCFSGPTTDITDRNCSFTESDTKFKSTSFSSPETYSSSSSEGSQCSILFSTHGASVDAASPAWTGAYYPQQNAWVVLPTGRRDYGYDWEGPGRINALSTLNYFAANIPGVPDALKESYRVQKDRIVFSGHSMGGHGCLILSSLYPDNSLGACCAAAWIKMWQYSPYFVNHATSFSDPTLRGVVDSAFTEYDTDLFAVHQKGIPFIGRTGSLDTSVIPWNLRRFIRVIDQESANPSAAKVSEIPGQGHWFDGVVDDAELQPFYDAQLNQAYKPSLPAQYSVRAVNLWGSGKGGVKILQQYFSFVLSSIDLTYNRVSNTWNLKTQNVRRFSISPLNNANPVQSTPYSSSSLIIDGQSFGSPSDPDTGAATYCSLDEMQLWVRCDDDSGWVRTERSEISSGPMRHIFETGPVTYIYGTKDNNGPWRLQRAMYMASTMFYQGRWGARILADTEVTSFPDGSNTILLGGPQANFLTDKFFSSTSMSTSGSISFSGNGFRVGPQSFSDSGIGLIAYGMYPNGSLPALLVVIAGTNIAGELDAMALLPLGSGIQIADYAVTGPNFKWRGIGGLLMTGFWSYDWTYRGELSYPRTFTYTAPEESGTTIKLSPAATVGVLVSCIVGSLLIGLIVGTFWCSKFHNKKETHEYFAVE